MKEPLRKIQIFASRILDKKDGGVSDAIMTSVAKMNDSAKRMQLLIADILSYSRLNHIDDGLELVNLSDLVSNIIDELNFEITEKNAHIEYYNLPVIKGVPFLLQQLLVNLLRNGLKFTKAGIDPFITITSGNVPVLSPADIQSPDQFYKIVISDNGIGFKNEFKQSIFKVFTRLHDSNEYSGSGVGLALCKKIMQNHNGQIFAEGIPESGATFSLYFPI